MTIDFSTCRNEAIRAAVAQGHAAVVRELLAEPEVDPSCEDNALVRLAAQNGHVDIVRALVAHGRVDAAANGNAALLAARDAPTVAALLESCLVDPAVDDDVLLREAVDSGDEALVRVLLADERVGGVGLVDDLACAAAERGRFRVLRLLVDDRRAHVGAMSARLGSCCLSNPDKKSRRKTVRVLLQHRWFDPAADDNLCVRLAATIGDLRIVKMLARDPRVNVCADACRAIILAARHGHVRVVRFFRRLKRENYTSPPASARESIADQLDDLNEDLEKDLEKDDEDADRLELRVDKDSSSDDGDGADEKKQEMAKVDDE